MSKQKKRLVMGMTIWGCVLAVIFIAILSSPAKHRISKVFRYFLVSPHSVMLESRNLKVGEKVISANDRTYGFAGYVKDVKRINGKRIVVLEIDPELPEVTNNSTFETQKAKGNMKWALKTVLPETKIDKIKEVIKSFQENHKDEITECSLLVAHEIQLISADLFKDNFSKSYKKHEAELTKVLDKHSKNMKETIIPVLKKELGDKTKEELKPLLITVGKELWTALPFWSFTWRVIADKLPYTGNDRTEKMFNKFLEEKAIPILSTHEKEFVGVLEKLTVEAAKNKNVRKEIAVMAKKLFDDPEFQNVIKKIVNECLIEPFEFEHLVQSLKSNKNLVEKFDKLQENFDPYLKEITKIVIKSEEGKIDDNLVIAIRRVFFEKGQRVVVYYHKKGSPVKKKYVFKEKDESL